MDTETGIPTGSMLSEGTGREWCELGKLKNKGGHRLPEARNETQADFPLWSSERTNPANTLILDFKAPALSQ